MSDVLAARFRVTGVVQGVGFRAATRREAQQLSLAGHAVNREDGSVEVLAEGARAALDTLETWLHRGPAFARVASVEREDIAASGRAGFGVG